VPSDNTLLQEISGEQLHKLARGNDIWALVCVLNAYAEDKMMEHYMVKGIPTGIQDIIHENADPFASHGSLPPNRVFDHAISLQPGSAHVNCRPYRYSPQQKDEVERHVATMLKSGTIVPSLSHFASPVLVVKKKDGSSRFCVDYRKLNANTVKNKFPLSMIDEFLDEMAGDKYFTKLDLNSRFHQIG
jgi:hypothetical protein